MLQHERASDISYHGTASCLMYHYITTIPPSIVIHIPLHTTVVFKILRNQLVYSRAVPIITKLLNNLLFLLPII